MRRQVPPLNALRAFEAAGRHESFARAAAELNITPGAVSQHVKRLEAWAGRPLFRRLPRGLALTAAGRAYLPSVTLALDGIAADAATLRNATATTLTVSALPAIAETWLVPRLGRFRAVHPEVDVLLSADARLVDVARGEADVGLRYSDDPHPALRVETLLHDEIFPVCSPALAAGPPALDRPSALARHTLLHDTHWRDDWRLWLEAAGVAGADASRGPLFTLYSMALQAAREGQGVAMGHGLLVADDLAAGRLVAPFAARFPAPKPYVMVSGRDAGSHPAVAGFRAWLLGELRHGTRGPSA